MALATTTITNSIAALSVAGLTILDVDQIPPDGTRLLPLMYPEPLNFMTDFVMERDSFGGGSTAKMTVTYNLHYTMLYQPIGATRTGLDSYDDIVAMATKVLDAVLAVDVMTGLIDIQPVEIVDVGPVPDPAGNMYLGCHFTFQCMEFVN